MADLPPGADSSSVVDLKSGLPEGADPNSLVDLGGAQPSFFEKIGSAMEGGAEASKDVPGSSYVGDIGRGALGDITGAGEAIPGIQPYAAKASQALHAGVTHPSAEFIGGLLPFMAGGGYLMPARLASLVPAGMEGSGLVPAASRILSSAGGGAVRGGVGAAEYGAVKPSGVPSSKKDEQGEDTGTYFETLGAKGKHALEEIPGGVLAGGTLGGMVKAIPEAQKYAKNLLGGGAEKAAEDLRSRMGTSVELAGSEAGAARDQSAMRSVEHQTTLQGKQAEMAGIQQKQVAAGQVAQQVIQELNANPKMSGVDLGNRLQKLIDDTYAQRVNTRKLESGFAQAVENNKDVPLDTGDIRKYVDSNLKDVASYQTRGVMSQVRGMTGGTGRPEEVTESTLPDFLNFVKGEVEGTNRPPLTLKRAESLRGVLDTLIRSKFSTWQRLSDKQAGEALHYAREIRSKLVEAMREASPQWAQAFDKFRELSRPLDVFERKGPLAGLAKEDPLSGDYEKFAGAVTTRVLNDTGKGAEGLKELIKESPNLKDAIRAHLMEELTGPSGLENEVTPKAFKDFMQKNREALEQAGLKKDFNDMRLKVESSKAAIDKLATEEKLKKGEIADVDKLVKEAQESGRISEKLMKKYDQFTIDLKPANLSSKDVATKADAMSSSLFKDGFIDKDQYDAVSSLIKQVKDKQESAKHLKDFVHHLIGAAILIEGGYELYRIFRAYI